MNKVIKISLLGLANTQNTELTFIASNDMSSDCRYTTIIGCIYYLEKLFSDLSYTRGINIISDQSMIPWQLMAEFKDQFKRLIETYGFIRGFKSYLYHLRQHVINIEYQKFYKEWQGGITTMFCKTKYTFDYGPLYNLYVQLSQNTLNAAKVFFGDQDEVIKEMELVFATFKRLPRGNEEQLSIMLRFNDEVQKAMKGMRAFSSYRIISVGTQSIDFCYVNLNNKGDFCERTDYSVRFSNYDGNEWLKNYMYNSKISSCNHNERFQWEIIFDLDDAHLVGKAFNTIKRLGCSKIFGDYDELEPC